MNPAATGEEKRRRARGYLDRLAGRLPVKTPVADGARMTANIIYEV